jgi:hypothetical protein
MVFRAQGESPASCARELGLNPAAPLRDAATHIEPKEFFFALEFIREQISCAPLENYRTLPLG